MKKKIDIEALLKWTYCEELPKDGARSGGLAQKSSWGAVSAYGELLTSIDDNRYGVVPFLDTVDGDPHPDALAVHAAVMALDDLPLDFPDDWNPMPELAQFGHHGLTAVRAALNKMMSVDEIGEWRLKRPLSNLVRRHALLGVVAEGEGMVPVLETVKGPDGGPLWFRETVDHWTDAFGVPRASRFEMADGWDAKRKRPKRGAYQKHALVPDPVPLLAERYEYQLWRASLDILTDELAGPLDAHEIIGTIRPVAPWSACQCEAMPRQSAILRDLKKTA